MSAAYFNQYNFRNLLYSDLQKSIGIPYSVKSKSKTQKAFQILKSLLHNLPFITMYRPSHPGFSLQNCITMQNRLPLSFVPKQYTTYFINSKRRFFLYFKYRDEMNQVIRIFEKQNVRFHPRKSMFPDREEQQEIVFHCNYKYKKKDLRWALHRDTRIREPVNRFNQKRNQQLKQTLKQSKPQLIQSELNQKNLANKEGPFSQSLIQQKKGTEMQVEETEVEYAADFGQIRIKNPEVLDLINNFQLIKALFKAEKKK